MMLLIRSIVLHGHQSFCEQLFSFTEATESRYRIIAVPGRRQMHVLYIMAVLLRQQTSMNLCSDVKGSMPDKILTANSPRIVTGRRWNASRYWYGEIYALCSECCEKFKNKKVRFRIELYVIISHFSRL